MLERGIFRIPLYLLTFLVCFLMSLGLTFPDDRVRDILIAQADARFEGKYILEIEDLDLWWLMGFELEGITLRERPKEGSDAEGSKKDGKSKGKGKKGDTSDTKPKDKPLELKIERAAVRLAPLSSAINTALALKIELDIGQGTIEGDFVQGAKAHDLDLEIDDVDVSKTTLLRELTGLPAFGVLNGTANIKLHAKTSRPSQGSIDIKGKQVTFGPGEIYLDEGNFSYIEVPLSNLGDLTFQASIAEGATPKLTFTDFSFKGRDIRGALGGNISLGRTTVPSLSLCLQLDRGFVKREKLSKLLQERRLMKGRGKGGWIGLKIFRRGRKVAFDGDPTLGNGCPESAKKTSTKAAATGARKRRTPASKKSPAAPKKKGK